MTNSPRDRLTAARSGRPRLSRRWDGCDFAYTIGLHTGMPGAQRARRAAGGDPGADWCCWARGTGSVLNELVAPVDGRLTWA
jgi:hypothetical protein